MKICAKCSSNKLIRNIALVDRYGDFGGKAAQAEVEICVNPQAWIFQGSVSGKLYSVICGDCGYVEMYVDNPQELYEAYLKSLNNSRK